MHTTNIKMKFSIHFIQLFLMVLWVTAAQADISLKLRNKQYLPPIQQLPRNQAYYNTKDTRSGRNNFENARYQFIEVHKHYGRTNGNGEDNQKSVDAPVQFPIRNYSPLQKISGERIRIEHINAPADFSLDDPNLDVSYLSLVTGNDGRNSRIIVKHGPTNSNIPVPFPSNFQHNFPEKTISQHSANQFMVPDYLPPKSEQPFLIIPEYQTPEQSSHTSDGNKAFKSTEYSTQEQKATRPDYLPPQRHGLFSGSPLQGNAPNDASQGRDYASRDNSEQNINFRNSNYFSSEEHSSDRTEQNIPPKSQSNVPDYVPPQTAYLTPIQENTAYSYEINHNSAFKGSDYLLAHRQPKQSNYQSSTAFRAPLQVQNTAAFQVTQQQILPPGYDFVKPPNAEQAIEELHKLPEESPTLEKSSNAVLDTPEETESFLRNGIAPTANDAEKPENSGNTINVLHNEETETNIVAHKNSKHSLPNYHFQRTDNSEHSVNQLQSTELSEQQHHSESSSAAEQARSLQYDQQNSLDTNAAQVSSNSLICRNKSQQNFKCSTTQQTQVKQSNENYHAATYSYQTTPQNPKFQAQNQREIKQISQSPLQQFKDPDYLPPTIATQTNKNVQYLPPTTGSNTGPEYMPPTAASETFKTPDYAYRSEVFKGLQYLPPAAGSQQASKQTDISAVFKGPDYLPPKKTEPTYQSFQQQQFKGPEYLPPTASTAAQGLQSIVMYPLSSYMTNIQPYDRYGSRRPFPEYGLPPTRTNINDVPPIYQTLASRPQHYAPTMSYSTNATLNSQSVQTESKDQETNKATASSESLQITKPTTAKIRTVKILNDNAVKTLKVLESLDHAGVKTIKILGSADEPNMADYRLVKVVTGSNEQNVQAVQIFNDHQDVTTNENSAVTIDQSHNSYLPPRSKRDSNNNIKIKTQ